MTGARGPALGEAWMPWLTVPELLRMRAAKTPEAIALIASGRRGGEVSLSWSALAGAAARVGNIIRALGIERGSRVGLFLSGRHGAEQHMIYHGVHAAGCVNVPINTRYTHPELVQIMEVADCRLVFVEREFLPAMERLRDSGLDARMVSVDGSCELDLDALLARAADRPPDLEIGPDDECDWVFTSGTTATPKAAAFTQRGCVATGIGVAKTWELVPGDVYQSSSPFFTSTGIHTSLLGAIASGCTYYLEPAPSPREWARRVAEHGSTAAFVSSPLLRMVLDHGGLPEGTTMRRLVYGGQTLPTEIHRQLNEEYSGRHGIDLVHLTGSTEGGPTGVYCPARFHAAYPGSIGDRGFAPWTRFDVLLDDGTRAREGQVGELWYAAPSVMARYVGAEEATRATLCDGGVLTGDLVEVGENGFLWFVDRKKDIIRRGGLNIASAEVEAVLSLHPGVEEAAAVPTPHEIYGEEVKGVVVRRAGVSLETPELLAFCAERLADYKVPVEIEFIDALPRNGMGKVVKAALRREARDGA